MNTETININAHIENNCIRVIVKPNSKKTEVIGVDAEKKLLRISVAAPADKGKANTELIKFLSKQTKKKARIKSGLTSKEKLIEFF